MRQKPTRGPDQERADNGLKRPLYVAMARTSDRIPPPPVLINVSDNGFYHTGAECERLGYCVFGKVVEGPRHRRQDQGVKRANAEPRRRAVEDVSIERPK